jgi:putative phosphoribosyl transferase
VDTRFRDRAEAGQVLAHLLSDWRGQPDVIVLGLPRGGVPVAYEVATALGSPLDVFLVRKLGVPGHEELAMGAIASGGVMVMNEDVVGPLRIGEATIESVAAAEERELARRDEAYRGVRPPPDVRGKTVILVDDGLATGSTMRVAIKALRAQQPERIIAAVPTGAPAVCREIGEEADDFSETTDDDVRTLLHRRYDRKASV